jgi:hypothetical protein
MRCCRIVSLKLQSFEDQLSCKLECSSALFDKQKKETQKSRSKRMYPLAIELTLAHPRWLVDWYIKMGGEAC